MFKVGLAQTTPSAQNLPYNQDFSALTHSAVTYPSGWMGWSVGTSTTTIFKVNAAIADRTLIANSSASTSTGNMHNYNGKIGFLNTGTLDLALGLTLNTLGKKNILLGYDAMTLRNPYDSVSNTRIRELSVQYRTDTTGPFTTLGGIEYQNNGIKQNASGITTPQNVTSKTIVLPSDCDNKEKLQIRWISRDVSGAGLRPSFAIDNIKVDTAKVLYANLTTPAFESPIPKKAQLNFSLSAPPATASSLEYSITGSADFNTDYTTITSGAVTPALLSSNSGTITLPAGISSFAIDFLPVDDALMEGMEDILFRITKAPEGFALKDSTILIKLIDDEPTPIHQIQGSAATAQSGTHYIEGIVTAVFPLLSPAGFYLQEEDSDADTDSNTSEGIFVVTDSIVAIGDKIRILGDTYEGPLAPSYQQACISPSQIILLSKDNPLPFAKPIYLPLRSKNDLEKFEGMLVHFKDTLTVSNNSNLGRYGEITLSEGGLVYQPSQILDPNDSSSSGTSASGINNVAALDSLKIANELRSILLDDGRASAMSFLPYVDVHNTLRVGSTVDSLWGIMTYAFDEYRIQPIALSEVKINHQPRPTLPDVGAEANIKVASFNVLNYFNGDGLGGGFPTTRGAHSLAEFARQRDKIIKAIIELDADIVGLIEIENDGVGTNSAIQNLVSGVNAYVGAGIYGIVNDGDAIQAHNTDEIRCGIIYKRNVLDTIGVAILAKDTVFNRPPLAQVFRVKSSDSVFVFLINHFKSKTCEDSKAADKDQFDGQGCYNDKRKRQAAALGDFINNEVMSLSKTKMILSLGDYNAYLEEDPLDTLRSAGWKILSDADAYSYSYQGQLGSLDNALTTNEMLPFITGVKQWNINSIEPDYLGYEDDVDDGGSDRTNFWSFLYSDDAFRCSDHDPVLVGLHLGEKLSVSQLKSAGGIRFYPNPVKDYLKIETEGQSISNVEVYNCLGQLLYQSEMPVAQDSYLLNLQSFNSGLYLLKVQLNNGEQFVRQFVKP